MKISTKKLVFIALAVAINIVGSKISLFLNLPIFLDSIGTMLSGIALGPLAGALTALVGGLVNGALGDIYSIYFSPSGMIMGAIAGLLFYNKKKNIPSILWKCFLVVLPASAVSACIETFLFGGVTSAVATTFLIQVLAQTGLKLLSSAFLTQLVTDYIDKLIAIILVAAAMKHLPYSLTHFDEDKADKKAKEKVAA